MNRQITHIAMALIAALAGLVLMACTPAPRTEAGTGPLTIAVSILPQQWFVQEVAGDRAQALVLVGPGQSPHSYEPTPGQLANLAGARAWITMGIEFEHALEPKILDLYPNLILVEGAAGVTLRPLEAHGHEEEDNHKDEGDDHDEEGLDPHTWLGREGALSLLSHVRDTLVTLDPAGSETYQARHDATAARINETFDGLQARLAPLQGRSALVYHPAFGYFLDEFDIRQVAIETGGKEPTPRQLEEILEEAREEGAAVVFVQKQFPATAARTIAEALGAEVVPLDDLDPRWLDNIEAMGQALLKAVQ